MLPKYAEPRRRAHGFTLIELLVAVAILGILGTVVITKVWSRIDDTRQTATKSKLDMVSEQIRLYKLKHNDLPRDLDALLEPDQYNNMESWLKPEDIKDAWNRPMVLKVDTSKGGQFEVISYGRDGLDNGFSLELGYDRDISSARPLDEGDQGR